MTRALECFTEILMSKKSSSSRMRASFSADSTSASGVGLPYFSRRSFSSEPAFTPIRIGTPRAFASRAIRRTLSWYLMLPGLIRSPWIPASNAAIAYFHWKWMSATTGTVDLAAMALSASASSQCGTATRTMSTPAATSDAICCRVALTSAVLVVVMDCTRMGASPPTSTGPMRIFRDFLRFASMSDPQYPSTTRSYDTDRSVATLTRLLAELLAEHVEHDGALLRLVQLEQQEPLPLPERRLPRDHRDGVGRPPHDHLGHVGLAVLPLVALLQVLGPAVQVVVGVVDVRRHQRLEPALDVVEGAVLPLVDQQAGRGVGAEGHGAPGGDAGVLDGTTKGVGHVDEGPAPLGKDLDARGARFHSSSFVSVPPFDIRPTFSRGPASGSTNLNVAPRPAPLSAQIRPPWASTTERAMASPMTVPPVGVNRNALSSKLNSTWWILSRSAVIGGRSEGTSVRTFSPTSGRATSSSPTTRCTSGPSSTGSSSSGTSPDSSRDRSSSCSTNRDSRSACWSMTVSTAGFGSSTPSRRFSRCARRAEMGVFSSWETFATRSRRSRSSPSISPAIRLNATARRPTSSREATSTRWR